MNATEHIVEAYYRLCEGCFTFSDRKVISGNNRQMDLLAYDLRHDRQYHIEASVTHSLNWYESLEQHKSYFEKKFFGIPDKKIGDNTDSAKSKNYYHQILQTYIDIGFSPDKVERVYVKWVVKESSDSLPFQHRIVNPLDSKEYQITVLSLRDFVLPKIESSIKTANYDDEIMRVMSLLMQRNIQTKSSQ